MTHSDKVNQVVIKEWSELGFYYSRDKKISVWRLVGSKQGLLKFCKILDEYVLRPEKAGMSEHEHYGPYSYLKIMTWDKPVINNDAIGGTLLDLKRLSNLIREKIESLTPPNEFEIDKEYSEQNQSKLVFEIKEDGFNPASADPHPYEWKKTDKGWN